MKYIDPNNQRYRFYVRECCNGYAIQVQNVEEPGNVPLTPAVASQLEIDLPDTYRLQSCKRENAERELKRLAQLNKWVEVDQ